MHFPQSNRSRVVMDGKPAFKWQVVLCCFVALPDAVVRGYHYLSRSSENGAAFDSALEWVVVCPLLHVLTPNLPGSHFVDDDDLLSLVPVPPDIIRLDEGSGVSLTYTSSLAGARGPPMPLMLQFILHDWSFFHILVQL